MSRRITEPKEIEGFSISLDQNVHKFKIGYVNYAFPSTIFLVDQENQAPQEFIFRLTLLGNKVHVGYLRRVGGAIVDQWLLWEQEDTVNKAIKALHKSYKALPMEETYKNLKD